MLFFQVIKYFLATLFFPFSSTTCFLAKYVYYYKVHSDPIQNEVAEFICNLVGTSVH